MYNHHANKPATEPQTIPFKRATVSSLVNNLEIEEFETCPKAKDLIINTKVWLPELPATPAITVSYTHLTLPTILLV